MEGGEEAIRKLDSITSKCVKNDKTSGYVAPKPNASKVRIGGDNSSVLTRKATPTQIATASTNAVLTELKPRKEGKRVEEKGTNFHIKPACAVQRGKCMVLTGDEVIAALKEKQEKEIDEAERKKIKAIQREEKKKMLQEEKEKKQKEREEKKRKKEEDARKKKEEAARKKKQSSSKKKPPSTPRHIRLVKTTQNRAKTLKNAGKRANQLKNTVLTSPRRTRNRR